MDKSMKAGELPVSKSGWRDIAVALNDQQSKREMAFYEKVIKLRPGKQLDMIV
jgi:hypothetical protein